MAKTAGSGNDWLSIANNSKALPNGKYDLTMQVDGKEQFRGSFVIGGAAQGTTGGAQWGAITFAPVSYTHLRAPLTLLDFV